MDGGTSATVIQNHAWAEGSHRDGIPLTAPRFERASGGAFLNLAAFAVQHEMRPPFTPTNIDDLR